MNGAELPCGTMLRVEPATTTNNCTTTATHLPPSHGTELVVDETDTPGSSSSTKEGEKVGPSVVARNVDSCVNTKNDDSVDDLDEFFDSL